MSAALLLFACTFTVVFALGLQSLNVNGGHHVAATLTSVAISASSIWLYKAMPGADALEVAAYITGAICGINASMWIHPRAKAWAARRAVQPRRGPPRPTPKCAPRPCVDEDEHRDVGRCGAHSDVH